MIKMKDFDSAIKRIKENPNNHGYSKEDYEAIISLDKTFQEFKTQLDETFKDMRNIFQTTIETLNFSIKTFFENLADTKYIINDNWFVSFNLISSLSLNELAEMLYNKDENNFQEFIYNVFPKEQKRIFQEIREVVPHRDLIINEIEQLYNNQYYASAIILAYSQVDGICNENLGYGFFDTEISTYDLKISKLNPGVGLASQIAFQLKADKNEITKYVKDEIKTKTFKKESYNRHLVMHGHSTHYGTKINAMRAISLLDFICTLKKEGVISGND